MFVNNEIYSFQMTTGQEMIATVVDSTDNTVTVKHPVNLLLTTQGPQMAPIPMTSDDGEYTISLEHVVLYGSTREDATKHYIELTTGIVTQSKKIIMG